MEKDILLIVDDVEINRDILESILCDEHDIVKASGGQEALSWLFSAEKLPSMALLDIMMPGMDGYEVLEQIKAHPHTAKIPVIFITAADSEENETMGLRKGAADYITKPFDPDVVKVRVANHLKLKQYQEHLEEMVEAQVGQLTRAREKMLETMANIIEYRNLESGHHVKRTSGLTKILADTLYADSEYNRTMTDQERRDFVKAVPMHDVGKIGIPDNILLKPGRLTPEEFDVIKTHTVIGANIVAMMTDENDGEDNAALLRHCRDIARHHHERWDGRGYPDGLAGEDIPLSARILAVVDVYDALISDRVYKAAFSHEETVQIIKEGAGSQFDPEIIRAFLRVQREFHEFSRTLE